MRRFAFVAVVGSFVGWAMMGTGGCSSETPAKPTRDAGKKGTSSSSSGDIDQSSTSSSSSSSSSGGETDGGKDASSGGPLASNPKKVTCGATKECDTSTATAPICCWPDNDVAKATCDDICEAADGLEFKCDENADCAAGIKCCLTFGGSACDTENNGCVEGPPLCKTDAECADQAGTKCNVVQCKRGAVTIPIKSCTNGLALPDGCEVN